MKLYFVWILLQALVWLAAMRGYFPDIPTQYWRLLSLSGYFLVFFLLPLFSERPRLLTWLFCVNTILTMVTLYPVGHESFHPYVLLLFALVAGEMAHKLDLSHMIYVVIVQTAAVSFLLATTELAATSILFIALYFILLFGAAVWYSLTKDLAVSSKSRYDALLTEYRALKRRAVSEEELARQEERTLIGHEIHDSVGHKLTALLMQLEVFRFKVAQQDRAQVSGLKNLAQDSLEETRKAVKTLKHGDSGGLHGIMRLIRNLESDSFLRTQFTVRHGAFSAPLSGEQSFVIYRSVQESLTNIMKHSTAREVTVMFEAPGGRLFRFEITNPVTAKRSFQEGFGLRSMRERLQRVGGELDVFCSTDQFVVRGWIGLGERGNASD